MRQFLTVVFVFLAWTCWLWPILFVRSLLKCIKSILHREEYEKDANLAVISLVFICISPFVIALLGTS